MTMYLNDLIDKIALDHGKKFNFLVENKIIDIKYIVSEVLNNGEGYQYLLLAKYGNLSKDDKKLLAFDLIRKGATAIILSYAKEVIDAPIKELEDEVIKENNVYYIYTFAKDVKGADINKLEDAIIKANNPEYIYLFARDIEYADTKRLLDALISTRSARFLFAYARDVVGAPLEIIEEVLLEIGADYYYKLFIKFKKEKQDIDYQVLNNLIDSGNFDEIIEERSKYEYLFEDIKTKKLLKKKNS